MKILSNGTSVLNDNIKVPSRKLDTLLGQRRLQLLADAVEKVEYEDQKQQHLSSTSPSSTTSNDENYPQATESIESLTDSSLMLSLQQTQYDILLKYITETLQPKEHQQLDLRSIIQKHSANFSTPADECPLDFSKTKQDESHCSTESATDETLSLPSSVSSIDSPIKNSSSSTHAFMITNKNGKTTRPFKAYPKDPLSLPIGFYSPLAQRGANTTSENLLNVLASSDDDFSRRFRKRIQHAQERMVQRLTSKLDSPIKQEELNLISNLVTASPGMQIIQPPKKRHRSELSETVTQGPIQRQSSHITVDMCGDMLKDDAYRERRRKNNEAAKRSRDVRRYDRIRFA
ncbi:unnamed protein product [Didymodactylos carnosus]|uniref:BZIP domain-containing protein n=1 Tax=Didymodactylos carnosus TaxID=1234261 RepID=A0A814SDQ9_9BILA|nr:unnamed protein product [Didymodactylos carnosus]CAF3910279.1 unnamed protein product [Didymodactylos carnosus]